MSTSGDADRQIRARSPDGRDGGRRVLAPAPVAAGLAPPCRAARGRSHGGELGAAPSGRGAAGARSAHAPAFRGRTRGRACPSGDQRQSLAAADLPSRAGVRCCRGRGLRPGVGTGLIRGRPTGAGTEHRSRGGLNSRQRGYQGSGNPRVHGRVVPPERANPPQGGDAKPGNSRRESAQLPRRYPNDVPSSTVRLPAHPDLRGRTRVCRHGHGPSAVGAVVRAGRARVAAGRGSV
jgi:hypothetical protein